jgi:PelA/Pel-15E family pectate lyase
MLKKSLLALTICALIPTPFIAFAIAPNDPQSDQTSSIIPEVWNTYYTTSNTLRYQDEVFLAEELQRLNKKTPDLPTPTKDFGFDINPPAEWFASAEGKRIMEIILSFQTPSGGWSKRTDMAQSPRKPGQAFGTEADYIPTFDNGATSTQLLLLAKAHQATKDKRYLDAFVRGLTLVLSAQYPHGGWPQSFPLRGGYHDHVTYNDGLMRDLMQLLLKVSDAQNEFSFVTKAQRQAASEGLERALDCVLKTQVIVDNKLTLWGAQHDAKTLQPAKARAYEMVSLASSESVWILDFLMDLENPSPKLIKSIHSAVHWYEQNKIVGKSWARGAPLLTNDKNAPPMWARFYEIGTNKPLFGDRDDSVHYSVGDVSEERRQGYAWYTTAPNRVLKKYADWAKRYPINITGN